MLLRILIVLSIVGYYVLVQQWVLHWLLPRFDDRPDIPLTGDDRMFAWLFAVPFSLLTAVLGTAAVSFIVG